MQCSLTSPWNERVSRRGIDHNAQDVFLYTLSNILARAAYTKEPISFIGLMGYFGI